nr:equilibrative nucleoside transporter 1 [Onthophagus taurus]
MSMDEASLQLNAPKDRYQLVYWIFLLHGIGVLTPWNMFITANDYFTTYKLSYDYTGQNTTYSDTFLQNLGFASQVPNLAFNWLNIFVVLGGNLTTRIVWSIWVEVIIFLFTIILAMMDTSGWPGTFFWLTMCSVVLLNMMNGVYQNTIFGMAAKLPPKYTGAVILGSNISGTFTAIVSVISKLVSSNQRMAAIYYFITALLVLLVCFDTYFALPLNRFYRHHELKEKRDAELRKGKDTKTEKTPYLLVFKQAYPQLLNIFMVFFVTLSLFPAVQARILKSDDNFFVPDNLYSDVTCFLTFNICAMLGSFFTKYFTWPKPKYLWIPVTLRFLYIPFYLLCNYNLKQTQRTLPVYITNDWLYWFVAITMGLTSGYFSSLGMMYAPGTVEQRYASTAGMFGGAALITGIFCGICSAYLWPLVITHIGV